MKRSDALRALCVTLDKNGHCGCVTDTETMAGKILNALQVLGMRPPYYTTVVATGKKYDPETDQGRDVITRQEWEPED